MHRSMLRLTLLVACASLVAAGIVTVPLTRVEKAPASAVALGKTTIPLIDFLDAQVRC